MPVSVVDTIAVNETADFTPLIVTSSTTSTTLGTARSANWGFALGLLALGGVGVGIAMGGGSGDGDEAASTQRLIGDAILNEDLAVDADEP